MKNSDNLEKIEIRSKKVRDIMHEEPPIAIRFGTALLCILLLILAIIAYSLYTLNGF